MSALVVAGLVRTAAAAARATLPGEPDDVVHATAARWLRDGVDLALALGRRPLLTPAVCVEHDRDGVLCGAWPIGVCAICAAPLCGDHMRVHDEQRHHEWGPNRPRFATRKP